MRPEEMVRLNIARNIARYRKAAGDTQQQLAEKLSYSDKSVSKWERGEGTPDVYVLMTIAELYSVTLNDLVGEEGATVADRAQHNRRIIMTLSVGLVWLVAALVFQMTTMAGLPASKAWLAFIFAIPAGAIVATVFACLWFGSLARTLSVSALVWGVAITFHLTVPLRSAVFIYITAAVMQVLVVLWFRLKPAKSYIKPGK